VYVRAYVAMFTRAVSSPRGCSSKSLPRKQRRLWWRDDVTILAADQLTSPTTLFITSYSSTSSSTLVSLRRQPTSAAPTSVPLMQWIVVVKAVRACCVMKT